MHVNLKGKTVLITGGASGAGVSIVKQFACTGCDIAFTYNRSLQPASDLVKELSPNTKIKAYEFNQANIDTINNLIKNIIDDFGHIDVLVNNAGIYPAKSLNKITEKDFDEMMDTNNKGVFFLSKEVAKVMSVGSIINISSINATNPASKLIHYGISKAAVEMQTKCLAYELGPNIRVNCVAPGLIYKQGQEEFIPGWVESYKERSALNKLVDPKDVANACIFFASDLSSAITGQILTVDCGVTLAPAFYNELKD